MEARLHFGVEVELTRWVEGYWSAAVEQLGLVVHGDDEQEVRSRLRQAVNELLLTFGQDTDKARAYLDFHNVESTLTIQGLPSVTPTPARLRERQEFALGAPA